MPGETDDFDLNAAMDSVIGEMDLSDTPSSGGEPAPKPEGESQETAPLQQESVASPPPAPARPLPKSWRKELEAQWGTLPPEVRDYVYEREGQVSRGLSQYQQAASSWNAILEPFKDVLQQHPEVGPKEITPLLQNLAKAHLTLSFGSPAEKTQIVKQLIQEYGITLDETPAAVPYEVTQRLKQLENHVKESATAAQMSVVEAFFKDPNNEHAKELEDDILSVLRSGQARDLPSAYQQAMWLNPVVRQKVLDKQFAERQKTAQQEAARRKGLQKMNGIESDASPSNQSREDTMDDTINAVIRKHYPQH